MQPRLCIDDTTRRRYSDSLSIGWDSGDGDGVGLLLGQGMLPGARRDADDPDTVAAEDAAFAYYKANVDRGTINHSRNDGYAFYTMKDARDCLRVCKAAIKALKLIKDPLSEWEQQALAAGWKPPKGRI